MSRRSREDFVATIQSWKGIWNIAREASKPAPLLFSLALCAVPISIALTELLLFAALFFHVCAIAQGKAKFRLAGVFWYWSAWAILELLVWFRSPSLRVGLGEIRHLLVIAAMFLLVPALPRSVDRIAVWCGIAWTATLSSLFLIGHFVFQLLFYKGSLDPVVYLRGGGLLHHWMIYGTVETLVVAGLLELWHYFPEKHLWLLPVFAVNTAGIVLSLTRMVWICSLLLLVLHLMWRRSRWLWAVPVLPCALFFIFPGPVRSRVAESMDPAYYSNAERVQMLRVGWEMIRRHPLLGVGPGRVEALYPSYLKPSDPLPAYHGHLHNNLVQLAAEFGIPVTLAALLFLSVLFRDVLRQCRIATARDQLFLCRTSVLAFIGYLATGLFDYTYGHSLGLILFGFAVLSPLTCQEVSRKDNL